MISVRDLRVDYDDVCAVKDLSFEVPRGEIYGLIGPNGAGKTTTLRTMVGLIEPTYGTVLLNGIDLTTHREDAVACVGFMPDFSPIYDDLTVYEFLDLFASAYKLPMDSRPHLIHKYIDMVELTEKRDALTAGLSRGMKQRLMLAKTLLPAPDIILLDEPASGLDPHSRILLKNILKQQGAEGKTIIISSHILTELAEFCTSIGIMERGHMVTSGKVEEIGARVFQEKHYLVEVLGEEERCAVLLASDIRLSKIEQQGKSFAFNFDGDEQQAAALLKTLTVADIPVIKFIRDVESLEDIFMQIGAREVA
ncbi:MAG: ABC transporter ATP-binding protein [bacterium]